MYKTHRRIMAELTQSLAGTSKCTERGVAAVILNENLTQIYSIGLNGGAKGLDDCMCITEGKYGCVHAEINALLKCPPNLHNKVMMVSLAPCKQCAAAIINSPGSFTKVYYLEDWKDDSGIKMLNKAGVSTALLTQSDIYNL